MKIQVFAEGKTEEKVIEKLKQFFPGRTFETIDCKGKNNINSRIDDELGPDIGQQPVRALILRDKDPNETTKQVVQSVNNGLGGLLNQRGINTSLQFQRVAGVWNAFVWNAASLDFRLAIHIASRRSLPGLTKYTIDDLVLQLALDQNVAAHLAQRQKVNVNGQVIIQKVTQEIPTLLQQNGFPPLSEAKDYVRLYAAVIRMHTSPPVFAEKVLASANNHLLQQNFASIIAAIRAIL
ncbi:hypothetical protein [Chloroflexus sp. Y-396-1]|uniref:hypothetical protein n=1 Tax=Chloroflexus sp. Y-396-1 TaxID=867845 RepID=UPI000490915E|nr:hypothetical protein [Chloroflexus sp. Y-396-1]